MTPQEYIDLFSVDPEVQVCYFQFLMAAIGKVAAAGKAAAAAAGKAAATAAKTVAESGAGEVAAGAGKAAATTGEVAGSAAGSAAGQGVVGGVTQGAAAAPLDIAQNALTSVPKGETAAATTSTAPAAAGSNTVSMQDAPAAPANPPAIEALLKPANTSTAGGPVHTPPPTSVLPGGRVSSKFGVTGGRIGPQEGGGFSRLKSSILDFLDDLDRARDKDRKPTARSKSLEPVAEVLDTLQQAKRVKDQFEGLSGGTREARTEEVPLLGEQPLAPEPILQVPQLARAGTSDLRLSSGGGKDKEPPLTLAQLRGLQQAGIMQLISELRTQRRLFG